MHKLFLTAIVFWVMLNVEAKAIDGGGGGTSWGSQSDGSGCCGGESFGGLSCCGGFVPKDKVEIAGELKQSFQSVNLNLLKDQRWAGTLCENHPCGDISEVNAKDLLDDFIAELNNSKANTRLDAEANDRRIAYGITFVALLVSFLTLAYTVQSNRRRDKVKS